MIPHTWLAIFLVLTLIPTPLSLNTLTQDEFVVWNVGQGQWTTWIHNNECWHFDVGGEYRHTIQKVRPLCAQKKNRLFLSHWDWDHIGFLPLLKRGLWKLCLASKPGGEPKNFSRTFILDDLPSCEARGVKNLWISGIDDSRTIARSKNRSNNHDSNVFYLSTPRVLIPGDSTIAEEKKWFHQVSQETRGLVLGHHGSNGSSSEILLKHLHRLQWAVASQRFHRYGHPHPEVVKRLRRQGIPLLKTEEWGSIHFLL